MLRTRKYTWHLFWSFEVFLHTLSIVIPCFDEADAIPHVFPALEKVKNSLLDNQLVHACEVLVVNDGSQDNTAELLSHYSWVKTIHLPVRSGYGFALKTGFLQSSGDWIVFFDLDGTYDPDDISLMLAQLRNEPQSLVIGERMSQGYGMPVVRRIGNKSFSGLVRLVYQKKIMDPCSGFRIFHRNHKSEILNLPHNGLNFSLAITLWAIQQNLLLKEVPIKYHPRHGQSKLKIVADGITFLKTIFGDHPSYEKNL